MILINMDEEPRNTRIPTKSGKRGCAWASQAGAAFSNSSTSELARDSESTLRTRSTSGPASHSTSYTRPVTAPAALALDSGRWSLDSFS